MAATLQRKCSGGIILVIVTKIITKIIVPRNYFAITSARMAHFLSPSQNPRFGPPEKKLMCLIAWERNAKGDQHNFFRGNLGVKNWRVPNPPGANPLVAERAFPRVTFGVPLSHQTAKTSKGPFEAFRCQGVSTRGVRLSPEKGGPKQAILGHKMLSLLFYEPPTMYRHHKGLQIKKGISKGVVYELSEPKRGAKCIPPPGLHWRCSSWLLWGWCADCGVRSLRDFMNFRDWFCISFSSNPTYS